jgi:hypothetical protein
MAKRTTYTKRFTVETHEGHLTVELVGGRPDSEPYLWIGDSGDDCYLDSIEADGLRLLAAAIDEALAESPRPQGDE